MKRIHKNYRLIVGIKGYACPTDYSRIMRNLMDIVKEICYNGD